MASLDSVKRKVLWSAQHLNSIEPQAMRYFSTDPGKVVSEEEPQTGRIILRFRQQTPIPDEIPLIIGDAIQNLRSSLDYLVWELVLAANNVPTDKNMFPICSTEDAFNNQVARHRLDGVPVDAIAEIKALQPYHYGQQWEKAPIQAIDTFCNVNKHRRLLLSVLAVHASRTEIISSASGTSVQSTLSPRYHDAELAVGPVPSAIDEEMEMKGQVVTFITFKERPAEGLEISGCLNHLWHFVNEYLLPKFEKFF
ncbi:MAG TPA: hypothetical protein VH437_12045 [Terriglobales bacterium]